MNSAARTGYETASGRSCRWPSNPHAEVPMEVPMRSASRILLLALLGIVLVPAPSQAQVFTWTREQMVNYTSQNPYERFPDGRPKVPDAMLEKVKGCPPKRCSGSRAAGTPTSSSTACRSCIPGKKLVGRAVTLQLMPVRPDVADAQAAEWKAKGWRPPFASDRHRHARAGRRAGRGRGREHGRRRDRRRQPGVLHLEDHGRRLRHRRRHSRPRRHRRLRHGGILQRGDATGDPTT